jgi:acetoin utilization protein AcuB
VSYQANDSMTRKVYTISWDDTLLKAYQLMKERKIRHLPVIRPQGDIVGVLSDRDLQRAMQSDFGKDKTRVSETAQFPQGALVRDYMNWPVLTVERSQDLKSVVKMMMIDKISSVIVTEESKLVGIITTQDLLRVLLDFLSNPGSSKKYGIENFFEDDWINSDSVV